MTSINFQHEFNQHEFNDWVKDNNYHLIQLFNCFQYNFKKTLPHTDKEWRNEKEEIFDVFCQFIYEYS